MALTWLTSFTRSTLALFRQQQSMMEDGPDKFETTTRTWTTPQIPSPSRRSSYLQLWFRVQTEWFYEYRSLPLESRCCGQLWTLFSFSADGQTGRLITMSSVSTIYYQHRSFYFNNSPHCVHVTDGFRDWCIFKRVALLSAASSSSSYSHKVFHNGPDVDFTSTDYTVERCNKSEAQRFWTKVSFISLRSGGSCSSSALNQMEHCTRASCMYGESRWSDDNVSLKTQKP